MGSSFKTKCRPNSQRHLRRPRPPLITHATHVVLGVNKFSSGLRGHRQTNYLRSKLQTTSLFKLFSMNEQTYQGRSQKATLQSFSRVSYKAYHLKIPYCADCTQVNREEKLETQLSTLSHLTRDHAAQQQLRF